MFVVLPNHRDGLARLESKLSNKAINDAMELMTETEVELWLPKFNFKTDYYLNEHLQKLGLNLMFTPTGDFSAMTTG